MVEMTLTAKSLGHLLDEAEHVTMERDDSAWEENRDGNDLAHP